MSEYETRTELTGYADSVNATGRIGQSAFAIFVDFAEVGAPVGTGLVVGDIINKVVALPQNCAVRKVVAQVVKPITVLSAAGAGAIPLTLKAGTTTLATLALGAVNGPDLGADWHDVTLANGRTDVDGTKEQVSLTLGAVTDGTNPTAITGGMLAIIFTVDYSLEVDELEGLYSLVSTASDGGNNAPELSGCGASY